MEAIQFRAQDKHYEFKEPIVMGILNVTPDSFYNKGRNNSLPQLLEQAHQMVMEGATILDIGGMSSRPNAAIISEQEEMDRIQPIIDILVKELPSTLLSVDTFRSRIAANAIEAGVHWINDISGGEMDDDMIETIAKYKAPYVCMHMQGTPQTMQLSPSYQNIVEEILAFFQKKIERFQQLGLEDVILDVGFGFGKTIVHNYTLLNSLDAFQQLQKPLLVGISRKSMVYKPLKLNAEGALNGTTALHMIALQKGASILRVHDVKEAVECVKLWKMVKEA
jgi:dihydropteroate synthase